MKNKLLKNKELIQLKKNEFIKANLINSLKQKNDSN